MFAFSENKERQMANPPRSLLAAQSRGKEKEKQAEPVERKKASVGRD
jgi:hypothetical protein